MVLACLHHGLGNCTSVERKNMVPETKLWMEGWGERYKLNVNREIKKEKENRSPTKLS